VILPPGDFGGTRYNYIHPLYQMHHDPKPGPWHSKAGAIRGAGRGGGPGHLPCLLVPRRRMIMIAVDAGLPQL
jgi:hypothetical protein